MVTAAVQGLVRNGMAAVDYVTPADGTDVAGAIEDEAEDLRALGAPVALTAYDAIADVPPDGHDVLIVAAEGGGLAELFDLSGRLRDAGHATARLLPIVATGERVVLGPLSGTTTGPCWLCAQLRLGANGDPAMAADVWREIALGRTVGRPGRTGGTVPAMIGNAAALETFRLLTGQTTPAGERHVVVQNAVTLESVREPLLPHPECTLCRDLVTPPAEESPLPEDAADEDVYERASRLVSPRVGILSGWADEPLKQIPLKIGRVRVAGAGTLGDGPRVISAFHADTLLQARMAALRSALSWYAGTCPDRSDVVTGTPGGLAAAGYRVVADTDVMTWTGTLTPGEAPRPYVSAVSLTDGTPALVPQAAAYPFSHVNRDAGFERTTAGAATGRSAAEITGAGLAGALAYRGLVAAVRGTAAAFELSEDVLERDEEARFAVTSLGHLGQRVRAYALPGARPGFAVLAVVDDGAVWAAGAGLSPRDALRAALRDVLGQAQVIASEGAPADLGDPLLADFDPRTGWSGAEPGEWDLEAPPAETRQVLASLAAEGLDAYLVDTTTADLRAMPTITTGSVLLVARPGGTG